MTQSTAPLKSQSVSDTLSAKLKLKCSTWTLKCQTRTQVSHLNLLVLLIRMFSRTKNHAEPFWWQNNLDQSRKPTCDWDTDCWRAGAHRTVESRRFGKFFRFYSQLNKNWKLIFFMFRNLSPKRRKSSMLRLWISLSTSRSRNLMAATNVCESWTS